MNLIDIVATNPTLLINGVPGDNLNESLGVTDGRQKELAEEMDKIKKLVSPDNNDIPSKIEMAEIISRVAKTPGELYFMAYTTSALFETTVFSNLNNQWDDKTRNHI